MNQFLQLISINFKEFFRQPGIIFWAVFFPILMAWGLGVAFTQKETLVQKIAMVSKGKASETSNEKWNEWILQSDLENSGTFEVEIGTQETGKVRYQFMLMDWDSALLLLKKGVTELIVTTGNDSLQFHFDPNNPEAQLIYLQLQAELHNLGEVSDQTTSVVPLKQKGTRYIDFLVPGLLCMSVMMSCMWGISYGMIDKRSKKLLRRMLATPMSKSLFLAAQFVARLGLSFLEAAILLLFCYFYFDVTISGGFVPFLLIFLAGNVAFTGIAIFASARTSDTRVGNGLVNLVVMPMMILSGIFFSYHNFPDWAVAIIEKLPLTLMADYTRSVFIEGAGISQIMMPFAILSGIGLIFFGIGLRIYKWY